MEQPVPAERLQSNEIWRPSAWSLRTKISVVLLLPVVVALILAGGRIQAELAQASRLSAVRDQLPVLTGTAELADLVGQEMVAAGSAPGSTDLAMRIAAVDAKTAAVQHEADFVQLAPDTGRTLNTALGQLGGLRTASAATGGYALSETSGYHDIVFALSQIVPSVVAQAGSGDLDGTANAAGSLVQLRADLAVEQTLLRFAAQHQDGRAALVAASRAATEEAVISGQIRRAIPAEAAARFAAATASAAGRQDRLDSALTATGTNGVNGTATLAALLAPLAAESAAIGGLVTQLVDTLSATVSDRTNQARSDALRDTALVLGALLGALAIALYVARSLVSPVRRLHAAALDAAHRRLPDTIERVRSGADVDWRSVEPVPVRTGEEIGQLASAFDEMHRQAVRLAGEQAELRTQVSEMFMTLSRRSQSLVELQLEVIEELESDEEDPRRLDALFRIDHMATRLRRNGENLQVLAGGSPARRDHGPVLMVDLLRAATSEVKDYRRISLGHAPNGSVRAQAAADVVHILAELLDNAIRFSPPEEKIVLTADRGADGGLLIEVVDTGLGMTADDVEAANTRLAAGDTVSPETTRRMGLFVVGRLAAPHGVTVALRRTMARSGQGGITASVHVPGALVIAEGVPTGPLPGRSALDTRPALESQAWAPRAPERERVVVNGSAPPDVPRAWPGAEPVRLTAAPTPPPPDPAPTPIFDRMVSGWFLETPEPTGGPGPSTERIDNGRTDNGRPDNGHAAAGPRDWVTPADETRQAAERAIERAGPPAMTSAGLPMRNPGARLTPGAATPKRAAPKAATPKPAEFRDPAAVRNNLSRHYSGMRAARIRTRSEQAPADDGKAEPR